LMINFMGRRKDKREGREGEERKTELMIGALGLRGTSWSTRYAILNHTLIQAAKTAAKTWPRLPK
jgi:hypothetical protein